LSSYELRAVRFTYSRWPMCFLRSVDATAVPKKCLHMLAVFITAARSRGQTALHFAAQSGHRSVVELLLKAGANVNAVTRDAKTPLDLAQNAALKVLLIKNGGRPQSRC